MSNVSRGQSRALVAHLGRAQKRGGCCSIINPQSLAFLLRGLAPRTDRISTRILRVYLRNSVFSLVVCARWLTLSPLSGPAGLSVLILPVEASLEAESGCLLLQTSSDEPLRVPVLDVCSSAHSRVDSCQSVHGEGGANKSHCDIRKP